ncbi:hypothetical protein KEM48_009217 [Puccinia striiformis f. sp. tritici PST-130]|nr:hypothetical protein KEM48_009217 [Puccinia striiformis f. sp. tritici PST-130]
MPNFIDLGVPTRTQGAHHISSATACSCDSDIFTTFRKSSVRFSYPFGFGANPNLIGVDGTGKGSLRISLPLCAAMVGNLIRHRGNCSENRTGTGKSRVNNAAGKNCSDKGMAKHTEPKQIDINPVLKVNIAKHCSQSSVPHPNFSVYNIPTPFFPKISIQFSSKSHNVVAIFHRPYHRPYHHCSDHSPNPTRRQSMRAITPASTDPKFIRPSNDSRKALKVVMSSESDQPGPPSKKKAPIVLAAPFVLAKKT